MCPHCTSQPSSFSFIAKQTIASILRLLYTSSNYLMPFQSWESKLFYTITIFFIIFYSLTLLAALPFLPIVTKISGWTRPDRQPCLSFSCYAPKHIHIYIWLLSDYSSNSCTILVLSPYYSPDQKCKPPFSCYASIYSPARWALDGPTLTDCNQCYTTRNQKYFARLLLMKK